MTYELTGSDIIAQLKESAEIKVHHPIFNRRQRRVGETYALSYFTNQAGIMELKIDYLKSTSNPIFTYEGSAKAKKHLQNIVEKHKLCLKYSSLENGKNSCFYYQIKKCKGVCCGKESITEYNKRVLKYILSVQSIKMGNSIFTKGRDENEYGFVYIENGYYQGYGFAPNSIDKNDFSSLKKHLIHQKDTRDARRIINNILVN